MPVLEKKLTKENVQWDNVLIPFIIDAGSLIEEPSVQVHTSYDTDVQMRTLEPNSLASVPSDSNQRPQKTARGRAKASSTAQTQRASKPAGEVAGAKLEPHETLATLIVDILSASGLRQHSLAIHIDGLSMYLWYFDRSGAIGSKALDFSSPGGAERLFYAFSVLCNLEAERFGFIPSFVISDEEIPSLNKGGRLQLHTRNSVGKVEYLVSDLKRLNAKRARGLTGRGTMVYSANLKLNPPNPAPEGSFKLRLLKMSWQPVERTSEVRFLGAAEERNIHGIPRLVAWGDIFCLSEGIRGRLQSEIPVAERPPDRVLRVIVLDTILKPLMDYPIRKAPIDFLRIFRQIVTSKCGFYVLISKRSS